MSESVLPPHAKERLEKGLNNLQRAENNRLKKLGTGKNKDRGENLKFIKYDKEYRRRVLTRFMMGESARSIAKDLGISSATISRWAKACDVHKGEAMWEPDVSVLDEPDEKLDHRELIVKREIEQSLIERHLGGVDGLDEQYQELLGRKMYRHLYNKVEKGQLPPINTWTDMEKYHKIMSSVLGLDSKGGGNGGRTRLDITLDIVEGKAIPTNKEILEAEIVDERKKAGRPETVGESTATDEEEETGKERGVAE